jgi:hypothetical protein
MGQRVKKGITELLENLELLVCVGLLVKVEFLVYLERGVHLGNTDYPAVMEYLVHEVVLGRMVYLEFLEKMAL